MSRRLRLKKAKHEYRQFLSDLSPSRGGMAAIGDPDPPVEADVAVPRNEAVKVFLQKRPEYNEFREQLLDVRNEQEEFFFSEDRWQRILAGNSA